MSELTCGLGVSELIEPVEPPVALGSAGNGRYWTYRGQNIHRRPVPA